LRIQFIHEFGSETRVAPGSLFVEHTNWCGLRWLGKQLRVIAVVTDPNA